MKPKAHGKGERGLRHEPLEGDRGLLHDSFGGAALATSGSVFKVAAPTKQFNVAT